MNCDGQDYAWVKQGMIFPFMEFMDRYVAGWSLIDVSLSSFR